jgi:hypothetical protein
MLRGQQNTPSDVDELVFDLSICEDITFTDCKPTQATWPEVAKSSFSNCFNLLTFLSIAALFSLILGGSKLNRKALFNSVIVICFFSTFVVSGCGSKTSTTGQQSQFIEMTHTVNNLKPNTTYYWKVALNTDIDDPLESDVFTFTTGAK